MRTTERAFEDTYDFMVNEARLMNEELLSYDPEIGFDILLKCKKYQNSGGYKLYKILCEKLNIKSKANPTENDMHYVADELISQFPLLSNTKANPDSDIWYSYMTKGQIYLKDKKAGVHRLNIFKLALVLRLEHEQFLVLLTALHGNCVNYRNYKEVIYDFGIRRGYGLNQTESILRDYEKSFKQKHNVDKSAPIKGGYTVKIDSFDKNLPDDEAKTELLEILSENSDYMMDYSVEQISKFCRLIQYLWFKYPETEGSEDEEPNNISTKDKTNTFGLFPIGGKLYSAFTGGSPYRGTLNKEDPLYKIMDVYHKFGDRINDKTTVLCGREFKYEEAEDCVERLINNNLISIYNPNQDGMDGSFDTRKLREIALSYCESESLESSCKNSGQIKEIELAEGSVFVKKMYDNEVFSNLDFEDKEILKLISKRVIESIYGNHLYTEIDIKGYCGSEYFSLKLRETTDVGKGTHSENDSFSDRININDYIIINDVKDENQRIILETEFGQFVSRNKFESEALIEHIKEGCLFNGEIKIASITRKEKEEISPSLYNLQTLIKAINKDIPRTVNYNDELRFTEVERGEVLLLLLFYIINPSNKSINSDKLPSIDNVKCKTPNMEFSKDVWEKFDVVMNKFQKQLESIEEKKLQLINRQHRNYIDTKACKEILELYIDAINSILFDFGFSPIYLPNIIDRYIVACLVSSSPDLSWSHGNIPPTSEKQHK